MNIIEKMIVGMEDYVQEKGRLLKKIGVKRNNQGLIYDKSKSDEVINILNDLDFVCYYIESFEKILKDDTDSKKILNVNFQQLEDLSNRILPNFNDRFKFIMYMANNNIDKGILVLKGAFILADELKQYPFKYLSAEEVLKMNDEETLDEFMNSKDEDNAKEREEFLDFMSKTSKKYDSFIEAHEEIKNHYLDVKKSYNEQDIDIFIKALEKLKLSKEFCDDTKSLLLENLKKRSKIQTYKTSDNSVYEVKQSNNKAMSKKEYFEMKQRVNSYFDLDNMQAIRPLSMDEITYCIHLLEKLGTPKDTIIKILKIVEKENEWRSPISVFNDIYEKLKYCDDGSLTENIELLKLCTSEACLIQEIDEYEEKRELAKELLDSTLKEIPKTFKYEFEVAHKRKE